MRIALIPGHGWKRRSGRNRWDPGASDDGVEEARVVRAVAEAAVQQSLALARPVSAGDLVRVFDSTEGSAGTYTERRKAAEQWVGTGPGIIVHLHCNAGNGSYLMCMHDHRSSLGAQQAGAWTRAADRVLRPLFARDPAEKVVATRPDDWTRRGNNLVAPSYASTPSGVCSVLVEVGFIDTDAHDRLWTDEGIALQAKTILTAWS